MQLKSAAPNGPVYFRPDEGLILQADYQRRLGDQHAVEGEFIVQGVVPGKLYEVIWRGADGENYTLSGNWMLGSFENSNEQRHVFRRFFDTTAGERALIYEGKELRYYPDPCEDCPGPDPGGQPLTSNFWHGIGINSVGGDNWSGQSGVGMCYQLAWHWIDGIPYTTDSDDWAFDIDFRYLNSAFEVSQRSAPDETADLVFHRFHVTVGPNYQWHRVPRGKQSAWSFQSGFGGNFSHGRVYDGTEPLNVQYEFLNGERRYAFYGLGFNLNTSVVVERPGIDIGLLMRYDFVKYFDDALESEEYGLKDQFYGRMGELTFMLTFR